MSTRHVTFWICLVVGWLAVLPASAVAAEFQQRAALSEEAAERYLVVINAANRFSGTPEEIRQLVRAIYLKQIEAWPSDQPGTPLARPPGSAAAKAFALDILDLDETGLEAYWSNAGTARPEVIENSRDLLRRISRDEGALAVITKAEAKKLPAKVRVLFEFTPPAPGLPETERVERYIAENEEHFKRRLRNFVRQSFSDQDVGWAIGANIKLLRSFKAEESRAEGVVLRIKFSGTSGNRFSYTLDERLLVRLEDGDIEILERLRKPTTAFDDDQDGRTQTAESAAAAPVDIRAYLVSHEDEAAEALDNYIVASDQPYGERLRELISHKVLEDRDVGSLVEFRYVGWDNPYAKQRVIARLEGGALTFYDPAAVTRLAALPSVASDAIDPMVQVDNGSAEVAALTTGTPLDTGAQETDDSVITEFDGLWESNDKPWHGTLEIKDGRYRTDLVCAPGQKAKASGRVLPGGRLEDSYFGVGLFRGSLIGSIEEMQIYGGYNTCQRGTLSFQRVTG